MDEGDHGQGPSLLILKQSLYQKRIALPPACRAGDRPHRGMAAEGKETLTDVSKSFVVGGTASLPSQEGVAPGLGRPMAAFRNASWRLRHRHRECVKAEVACAVDSEAEIDEETRYLLRVLSS